jgi:glycosyltransferase involved in cell wall biosynthesis
MIPGDATSGHTLQLQRLLWDLGHRSEIYALAIHPDLEHKARLVDELRGPSRRDRFLVYQYSAVSALADWLIGRREPMALAYHNITPPELFRPWERDVAMSLYAAQVQVAQLAPRVAVGICDSTFNACDLRGRGVRATAVSPILLDVDRLDVEPDPRTVASLERRTRHAGSHWLFVGGVAPHKAQHRLVQALALYRRVYDREARLSLVGRPLSDAYDAALRRLVWELGLQDAVDVAGAVSHTQLVAYYRAADVFVSASEHEGFCVPLVEAMHHGVPVVAFGAGAVPETLGPGGVLLAERSPSAMAAAVALVVPGAPAHDALVAAGRARADHFSLARTRTAMAGVLRRWVEAGGVWSGAEDA